jgi:hypothetical protein
MPGPRNTPSQLRQLKLYAYHYQALAITEYFTLGYYVDPRKNRLYDPMVHQEDYALRQDHY